MLRPLPARLPEVAQRVPTRHIGTLIALVKSILAQLLKDAFGEGLHLVPDEDEVQAALHLCSAYDPECTPCRSSFPWRGSGGRLRR
jgi:hypothetical protein